MARPEHEEQGVFNFLQSVYKISLPATIYCLWRERNSRIVCQKMDCAEGVIQSIVTELRYCISSWRNVKGTAANRQLHTSGHISYFLVPKMYLLHP